MQDLDNHNKTLFSRSNLKDDFTQKVEIWSSSPRPRAEGISREFS